MKKYTSWIVVAAGLIIIIYVCRLLIKDTTELEFFISMIGTLFTILAFAITLDQIRQTKSNTEETRKAVEDTKGRIQTITKAFSIADAIRLAESTEGYLRNKQLGESLIKLQEFSQILININDDELKTNDQDTSRKLTQYMQLIKLGISSLNKPKNECQNIDWNVIIANIEDSKNLLSEYFTKFNRKV